LHEILTDQSNQPSVAERDARTMTIEGDVGGYRVAVNVHLPVDGRIDVNACFGKSPPSHRGFTLKSTHGEVRDWFGDRLARYLEAAGPAAAGSPAASGHGREATAAGAARMLPPPRRQVPGVRQPAPSAQRDEPQTGR
jgi:hypothetical protein